MRKMKDPEKEAMLKVQRGYRLAKEGLVEIMGLSRETDPSIFLKTAEFHGETVALHARVGQAAMAEFEDGAVVVMGPGR